jgi:hypothetical protein
VLCSGAWAEGPLQGKQELVKKCAKGDHKACVDIAKNPAALKALRKLIPSKLRK